jgi:hypothetical protein
MWTEFGTPHLGQGSPRRLLAAGLALALGAQTALLFGSVLGAVFSDDFFKHELGAGCFIGFAAAALLLAAGVVGRRSPEEQAKTPSDVVVAG